ncbi:glutathione ABC transporter substrate-binding protein [Pseudochrobactrum sp. MP213Fo]|uniref:glutathione ABC transporter substrate-binding protein n=1 Tax=Pseudochrobactrum sp. MP213Fo TaxID=3022250 RepID=UPI003BA0E566
MKLKSLLLSSALAAVMMLPGAAWAKSLTVAVPNNLTGLDPTNINDTLSQTSLRLIYQGLFGFDKDMKLVPLLAESFEANDDATEFTIKLRQGVKFHDGSDFNAEAAKINIERLANPDNKLSRRSLVSMVDKVEVIDGSTIKLILKQPFGAMIASLAHPGAMFISPAALEKYGKDISRNPVGTGPFKFKSWSADTLEVVKNDTYWKDGLPKVDGVTVRSVPESGARFAMLQTGETQFVPSFPPELIKVAEKNPAIAVNKSPSIVEYYVSLNTMKKPFDDIRVRHAFNHAVDKDAYCKIVYNDICEPADSIIPKNLAFHVTAGNYEFNVEKAKELMKEAGFESGFETEIWSNSNTESIRAAQFIQQQLAQINVKVTVTPLEAGVAAQKIWSVDKPEDATVQLYYAGWSASTGDADWGIRPLFYGQSFPPAMFNTAYFKNATVDGGIEGAISTADPAKRAEFYAEVQKAAWAEAPWIFLGVPQNISAQSNKLSGVYMLPDRGFLLEDAEFTD